LAGQAWQGTVRSGRVRQGDHGRRGLARLGGVGKDWQAWHVFARSGEVSSSTAGVVRRGVAEYGGVRQAWHGGARRGRVWQGTAGKGGHGMVSLGEVGKGRRGGAWRGTVG
jgi:hypothetical protein